MSSGRVLGTTTSLAQVITLFVVTCMYVLQYFATKCFLTRWGTSRSRSGHTPTLARYVARVSSHNNQNMRVWFSPRWRFELGCCCIVVGDAGTPALVGVDCKQWVKFEGLQQSRSMKSMVLFGSTSGTVVYIGLLTML